MEQIQLYIEREANKDWNQYVAYLNHDENHKDLESIISFMYEDILPESMIKSNKATMTSLQKSEKIQLLNHPESFLYKYVQNIFKREKNVNHLVIRSMLRSFQGVQKMLGEKKKECASHMKQLIQFFVDLKKSERIVITNKKLELSFQHKSVLVSKMSNPYELGEIFGRYLFANMFKVSSHASEFYKNIYGKIRNNEFQEWHPLLKYHIFHFIMIEELFKKDRTEFSQLFNIKSMSTLLRELSILKYGSEQNKKKGDRKDGRHGRDQQHGRDGRNQQHGRHGRDQRQGYHGKDDRKRFHFQRGGGGKDQEKILRGVLQFQKAMKKGEKKSGEKRKYEERNALILSYNKILKETKVYNVYPGQEKSSDTLYSIFIESQELKEKIVSFYDNLLFQDPSHGYCQGDASSNTLKCDFKKKVPIIYAEENPDAYFSIENDLFSDKSGPKKQYATRGTTKEDRDQILNTLKEKLTLYKANYVFHDKYFDEFTKNLKSFQTHLIYLIYTLYAKKYNLYKTFETILESVLEESKNNFSSNQNESYEFNMEGERGNNMNRGSAQKNIVSLILEKKYNHLSPEKEKKMDYIHEKLKTIYEYKQALMKAEFGSPNYDNKVQKIDKYIQLLRIEAQKILNQ